MVATRLVANAFVAGVAALWASGAEGVAVLRGAGSAHRGRDEPAEPTVGADCGQIHHVIKKFSKATQVGKLAGLARAALTRADAAAGVAENVVEQANSAATAIGDEEILKTVISDATSAGEKATGASTALGTSLGTFKDKVSASQYSGEDVAQSEIDDLKKLTEDANEAAELAYKEAKRLSETTDKAVSAAVKDTEKAAKVASAAVKSAGDALDAAAKAKQNATWAVDGAAALEAKAAPISEKIGEVVANATEQAAVWQALKDTFDSEVSAVIEAKDEVTKAITPLETAVGTLKDKITPVKEAATQASSGSVASASTHEEVSALDEAESAVAEAVADLQGEVKKLEYGQERLKAKIEEAEDKLA